MEDGPSSPAASTDAGTTVKTVPLEELLDDLDMDPIVREVNVYLNRLGNQDADFFLLQYPLRPVYRPYGDHGQLYRIRHRPDSKRLSMTYALNTEGEQFSVDAKQTIHSMLALQADGKLTTADVQELDALRMHTLHSTMAVNEGICEYAVGFMKDGDLYITPTKRVLQFRPDFSHIDRAYELSKTRAADVASTAEAGDTSAGPSPAAGTRESYMDRGLEARVRISHAEQKQKEDSEPLKDIEAIFDPDSPEAAEICEMLCSYTVRLAEEVEVEGGPLGESAAMSMMLHELGGNADDPEVAEIGTDGQPKKKIVVREIRTRKHPDIPGIHFDPNLQQYLRTLCSGCSTSVLAGTRQETGMDATAGVGTGPLSYLALSRLTLQEQVAQILRVRRLESFNNIKQLLTSRNVSDAELIGMLSHPDTGIPARGLWVASSNLVYPENLTRWTELERNLRDLIMASFAMDKPPRYEQIQESLKVPPELLSAAIADFYVSRDGKLNPKRSADSEFARAYPQLFDDESRQRMTKLMTEAYMNIKAFVKREHERQGTASRGTGGRVDTLDPLRVRTVIERILRERGATTESHILDKLQEQLRAQIADEIKQQLSQAMMSRTGGAGESAQVLERKQQMETAIEQLEADDINSILLEVAELFRGLWVLRRVGDDRDIFRRLLLEMYKADPERIITKKDFQQECAKKQVAFTLTDVALRQVFKEIAVLEKGYWRYKGSQAVQQTLAGNE